MAKITFSTDEYVRSHGKEPRSNGYGGWMFDINLFGDTGGTSERFSVTTRTMAEAKAAAKSRARQLLQNESRADCAVIEILP